SAIPYAANSLTSFSSVVAIAFGLCSKQLQRASLVPSLRLPIAQGRENEVASFQRLTFSSSPNRQTKYLRNQIADSGHKAARLRNACGFWTFSQSAQSQSKTTT